MSGVQPGSDEARERSVPGARSRQGGTPHDWRDVAAREPEARKRDAPAGDQAAGGRGATQIPSPVDLRLDGARLKRFDARGAIAGGHQADRRRPVRHRRDAATRRAAGRFSSATPPPPRRKPACARTILRTLAHRAFRRPVTNADIQPLYAFYQKGRAQAVDFESGIQAAIEAMLVSPEFLFRIEQDPPAAESGKAHRISDVELASRLSFFLWSTIPDAELLELAERGRLIGSSGARAPGPPDARRSARRHPRVELRRSVAAAAKRRNGEAGSGHLPVRRGAAPGVPHRDRRSSSRASSAKTAACSICFRPTTPSSTSGWPSTTASRGSTARSSAASRCTDVNRRGLLGQGSVLTVTSYPNRTSVVQRGKWVLENLLGTPPPPPPADVPELKAAPHGKVLSMREQMQVHRANPTCAACHARMDPIGFALENYDARRTVARRGRGRADRREREAARWHRVSRARPG